MIGHAAQLLGLPEPPAVPFEESADDDADGPSFYSEFEEGRGTTGSRMSLGVKLLYPDYPQALPPCLQDET